MSWSHFVLLLALKESNAQMADGTGWMPAVFKGGHDAEPQERAQNVEASEVAADEGEAHALAA